jgi:hypothetical protein
MRNIIIILATLFLFVSFNIKGQVVITFNTKKEKRSYAKPGDTLNIEYTPNPQSIDTKYKFNNITINYAFTDLSRKKLLQASNHLTTKTTSLKNPVIKIPIEKYANTDTFYQIIIYVGLEIGSIELIKNGKKETLSLLKNRFNKGFTFKNE